MTTTTYVVTAGADQLGGTYSEPMTVSIHRDLATALIAAGWATGENGPCATGIERHANGRKVAVAIPPAYPGDRVSADDAAWIELPSAE